MGFSNNMTGESQPNDTSKGSGLEDRLAGYFKSRFPVAGGLAQAVFGGGGGGDYQPQQPQSPLLGMISQPPPVDSSLIGMNAMPKQGGGGGALLLKLLGLVKE